MDSLYVWGKRGSNGWKQAAKVNCIVLASMSVTLIGCLISATTQGDGIGKALFFYDGGCDGGSVSQLNVALHLLINVVSTLVVSALDGASSNFFMQVLNSPSREEINAAHFRGSWMGIGIPSVRNAFKVSRFKTVCWLCLLVSSIPIHLLFNSTVFQTDRRDSDFHVTVATEEFLNGASFYPPGAGLVQAGYTSFFNTSEYMSVLESQVFVPGERISVSPYGQPVNLTDYANKNSDAVKNISATATNAGRWERLERHQCKNEYIGCSGLKEHRNLVLVIDKPGGWIRNEMWHLLDNQTEYWDQYVPPAQSNHLFFSAQCEMYAERNQNNPTTCENSCTTVFGVNSSRMDGQDIFLKTSNWVYPFFEARDATKINGTNTTVYERFGPPYKVVSTRGSYFHSGLQPGTFDMSVKYCLAEPLDRVCHVALSPSLLLAVTLCVIFKTLTAILVTIVLSRRNEAPLVTPGDAMESFLEKPDRITADMCTIGQADIRRAMRKHNAFLVPGPRQWKPLRQRRGAVIPLSVWLTSYLLFAIGICVCAYFFGDIESSGQLEFGTFLESEQNAFIDLPFTFFGGVLLANSPQILLSVCYLAYNNMFTRLQMAREWSLFSQGYHGLRVTDPKGDQYSTYRLQLPYKYSIPLIAASIFLHWLLSNTIYLFVSTGGYFGTSRFISGDLVDSSLPPNTAIAVGYSGKSLMAMLIVSCVLIIVPFILSVKRLPPNMVNIGSNSLAISAACHVSTLSILPRAVKASSDSLPLDSSISSKLDLPPTPRSPQRSYTLLPGERFTDDPNESSFEMQALETSSTLRSSRFSSASSSRLLRHRSSSEDSGSNEDEQSISPFRKLARSKIRWGIVPMSPEWHVEHDNEDGVVEHLSFGVVDDDVKPPEAGRYYA